jgi:hypothetical protein
MRRNLLAALTALSLLAVTFTTVNTAQANSVNVRINPLAALFGMLNAEIDFKMSDSLTVGPSLSYWSISLGDVSFSAYSLGVRANYYFGGGALDTDGWYLGPYAAFASMTVEEDLLGDNFSASASGFGLGAMIGHQWMWETFNINLGLGFGYYMIDETQTAENDDGVEREVDVPAAAGTSVGLEFTLGWAF